MTKQTSTPWGAVQDSVHLGPDVARVSTASHGGLHVTGAAANAVPAVVWGTMINGRGWAEEDCEEPIILALLLAGGHITNPNTRCRADDIREAARRMVDQVPRYADIEIPDEPETDTGFPVSIAGMFFPAC